MSELKQLRTLLNDYYSSRRDECSMIDEVLCKGVVLKLDEFEIEPTIYGNIEGKVSCFRPNKYGDPKKDYGFLEFFIRQESSFDLVWYKESFKIERSESLESNHYLLKNFNEYIKSRSKQYSYLKIKKNQSTKYETTPEEIQRIKNQMIDHLKWIDSSMFDIMNCETLRKFLNELNYPCGINASTNKKLKENMDKIDILPYERDLQRLISINSILVKDNFYSLMFIKEDTSVFWDAVEHRMKIAEFRYKDIYKKLSRYQIKDCHES